MEEMRGASWGVAGAMVGPFCSAMLRADGSGILWGGEMLTGLVVMGFAWLDLRCRFFGVRSGV